MKHLALIVMMGVSMTAWAQQKLGDYRRVVIPDKPLEVQKAAAEDLALYAGRVAGTKIEIIPAARFAPDAGGLSFFVGDTAAKAALGLDLAPWTFEEYLLRTVPQGMVLAGEDRAGLPWSISTPAGSMLAVYTLLEDHLGVHWFWPGHFGEHVPSNPDAVIPSLDVRRSPKLIIRSIQLGYTSYHTKAFGEDAKRWARRSRLGWTRSAVFGHSWFDAFNFRNDESFKAHPEWFALVDGKRRGPQMCTTHPEVVDHMVQYVLKSKTDITNISPSDGGGFCECNEQTKSETHKRLNIPSCTSYDIPGLLSYDGKSPQISDRIFTYANEIARRVREKNPDKSVGIIAYTFYNKPPRKIEKLESNLYLSFVYQCAAHRDPVNLKEWRDGVDGWQKLGAKMVIREGWGNHYYLDLPFVQYNQIMANMSEASKRGFVASYGEGSKCFATQSPNYWALTHMMWDPDRDTGKLMEEYWTSAYGPAAAEMKAYFETYSNALDRNWERRRRVMDTSGIAYVNIINSWHILFPPEVVAEAETHLVSAEKSAPKGEYADRVAFHRAGQDYTRVMLDLLDHYRRLTDLGMKLDMYRAAEDPVRQSPAEKQKLLKEAYDLGEQREQMLLAHRDWAAMDEGLYAFTNDGKIRQWHSEVKEALGINRPTALTRATLK